MIAVLLPILGTTAGNYCRIFDATACLRAPAPSDLRGGHPESTRTSFSLRGKSTVFQCTAKSFDANRRSTPCYCDLEHPTATVLVAHLDKLPPPLSEQPKSRLA